MPGFRWPGHIYIVAIFIELVNRCVCTSGAMYNFDWDVSVPRKLNFITRGMVKGVRSYVEN